MTEQALQPSEKQQVVQGGEATKPEKCFIPAVDIYETEQEVTVISEMPGVAKDGVEVTLEDNVLTISGTAPQPEESRLLMREYETGCYQRRFTVAESIDQEAIQASMAEGMLKVVLPKAKPASPRKIAVQMG
ncbi:MAG: heat-shock protein Hsp20 [Deltaproteobacteria bacterium]|nr:MAG: heat-shock protein Hsp20 [Deltaproteobacteria bacterium]